MTPQPAAKPEAPATLRRSGLRERVPSSKQAPRMAALERLQRLRSGGGGALGEAGVVECGACLGANERVVSFPGSCRGGYRTSTSNWGTRPAAGDSEEDAGGDGSLGSGSSGSGAEDEQGEEGSDAEEQPSSGIDDFIVSDEDEDEERIGAAMQEL